MNRINKVFFSKKKNVLNIYFTAGYPKIDDTLRIARALQAAGTDIIEIGIPYSDPIADGTTIQYSSQKALDAGMSLKLLMIQLQDLRKYISIPVILMGYINPVLQYGFGKFCRDCKEYLETYQRTFEEYGIYNIFLITPQTSERRILRINEVSKGFIYMVSSASITGAKQNVSQEQVDYFARIQKMNLSIERLIGFGISNKETFKNACKYASGAIIGSAFINQLSKDASDGAIISFVGSIVN